MTLLTTLNFPEIHPHVLSKIDNLAGHTCDICKEQIRTGGYRCPNKECDFDYCNDCLTQMRTIVKTSKVFPEEPFACDFYNKSFHVKVGSDEYKQILDMYFLKQSKGGRSSWKLNASNIDKTVEVFFGRDYKGLHCNTCKLDFFFNFHNPNLIHSLPCVNCETNNYRLSGEELLLKQRMHLEALLVKSFPDVVILTLSGTYCA